MANKPVLEKRFGMLRLAAWDNVKQKKDGTQFLVRSFTLTKSWPNPKWVMGQTAEPPYIERSIPINKSDVIDVGVALRCMEDNFHIPKKGQTKKEEDVEAFL